MTPQDMAALHARCFTAPPPWSAQSFASLLSDTHILLCTLGTADAFLMGRVVAGEGEVLTLATDPNMRRQGLARRLLAEFESRACARGAQSLFLEVAEDNLAALALYQSCGFTRAGRRPGYYVREDGTKTAAMILCKSVA